MLDREQYGMSRDVALIQR